MNTSAAMPLEVLLGSPAFTDIELSEAAKVIPVTGITLDSRAVESGYMFVAVSGSAANGSDFIDSALENGASVVLADDASEVHSSERVFYASSLKNKLGELAAHFYGSESSRLNIIGVTGTNGKSTCCTLIAQLERCLGREAGVVGTLGYGAVGKTMTPTGVTTPDVFTNHRILKELEVSGCQSVAVEASSHGLEQGRVSGVNFSTAVFTNLTQDHLDYHKTFDEYAAAKKILFGLPGIKRAVINIDADYAQLMIGGCKEGVALSTYSVCDNSADFFAENIQYRVDGLSFDMVSPWGKDSIKSRFLGDFNVANILASVAACCSSGEELKRAVSVIEQLKPVDGRMAFVDAGQEFSVLVDYAHTPDALEQACISVRKHLRSDQTLSLVFGCGGNRDVEKRALMGRAAQTHADRLFITSDNPRREDPEKIIHDILDGVSHRQSVFVESDRKKAIAQAIAQAGAGDIVLIAGKGHENYQDIQGVKHPFCDTAVARECLLRLTSAPLNASSALGSESSADRGGVL